ncbi:MAG: recombinase zinc beta ribbon domain-containing protein, partial [Abitibacteriaceae bacterium]|nr:recombinase zinc beta ribbon domain-containing protein [Abditibacteriaceae bacterium]
IQSKLEQGHFPHRALPGYINNKAEHTIQADAERFELIQRAMKLVATGAYSVPEALAVLNRQWGFRTRKTDKTGGRPLSRTTFYDMLSNIFYTGQMLHDGVMWPGKHPPMLTQHEFDRIQKVIARGGVMQRHHQTAGPSSPIQRQEFDYTGFIRCKRCGCLITAETRTKQYVQTSRTRTYTYYHCTNSKGGCSKQSVSREWIEDQILALLSRVTPSPQVALWCQQQTQGFIEQEAGMPHQVEDSLRRALANAERRKSNLFNDRFTSPDLISVEEFREQKEKIQREINGLRQELARAQERVEVVRQSVNNVFDFVVHAKYNFEQGGPKIKKEIAQRLGISYLLTLEKLEIVPHPLLVPIFTIEPPKSGSGSKKDGGFDTFRPSWLTIPDEIRNLAMNQNLTFEKIEWPLKAPF